MTTAYSFLRFSSEKQRHGDSLNRQMAGAESWCLRKGVTLNKDLYAYDPAVSAFCGKHRGDPDRHALAAFLDWVKRGNVERGSYLIVESLDRLSREHVLDALHFILGIIQDGVSIVQLIPVEIEYDHECDPYKLMQMIMELSRGHSESETKSVRVAAAWDAKKKRAREEKKPLGHKIPSWLKLVNGKYEPKPEAVEVVRKILKWSAEGVGDQTIVKRLNDEGIPHIADQFKKPGKIRQWHTSFIDRLIENRALIGEYQPHKGRGKNRKKDGDPMQLYPPIVEEKVFEAVLRTRADRNKHCGRPAKGFYNVFQGKLYDALDECPLHIRTWGRVKCVVSYRALKNIKPHHCRPFPVEVLNTALLEHLRELPTEDLFAAPGSSKRDEIETKLAKVERRLKVAREKFREDPDNLDWQNEIDEAYGERRVLRKELNEAIAIAARPASASWEEFRAETDLTRIRPALLRTVAGVYIVVMQDRKIAFAQVQFKDGGGCREYWVHRDGRSESKKLPKGYSLDLRNPEHARIAEGIDWLNRSFKLPDILRDRQPIK
jgi:DNA invertase Pin-like site-specific DNA recombinase